MGETGPRFITIVLELGETSSWLAVVAANWDLVVAACAAVKGLQSHHD